MAEEFPQSAIVEVGPGSSLSIRPGRADEEPALVYLAGLAPGSRPTMSGALDTIARIVSGDEEATFRDIPWQALRFQHTAAIRAELAGRYSHATANKMLSALRGVLKAAWKLGLIDADAYHKAASVESVKGDSIPAGRAVPAGELAALIASCGQKKLGVRDAAILALLYGCGLRRAEVVALNLEDYQPADKMMRVRGKRNKQRLVPVVGGAAAALGDWLALRGLDAGPLFTGVGNRNRGRRLTTQAIWKMVQTRARRAGIPAVSPHDFRRTFVGDLLDRGADIVTVQKLAGHANVSTTARYDRRDEKTKQRAAELLHVPYQRRTLEPSEE
jgi:site-specific recombinase XerD